jgi:asparagine synthase (glutamine-hydrolysing)
MCGIAGMWNYKTGAPVERERLVAITDLIAHRGPDGDGYYWGPGPGLGHRRLSIIDLEGGHQPMCNEDGTVWIIFNGEIYNFPELRDELVARGHKLKTRSDTEAIIHLYEDYGTGAFEKLRGMFALALWDQKNQQLVLARDRLGIKPLFYGVGNEGIVFGSELKCIHASGQVDLDIDPTAIADLFTYFYIPGPKTIYRNAYSLEPGHALVVRRSGIHKEKYWDLQPGTLQLSSEREYEDALYDLLGDTVRGHLLSDVPLGAFLSGGVDSSGVVALMARQMPDPVITCSIGFDVEEFNELENARFVAGLFKTNHTERVVTPEPAKVLENLVRHYHQPFPDTSAIPTYFVSQLARERVKVVLSGDGGDENFAGYSRYRRHLLLDRIRELIPGVFLKPFSKSGGDRHQNGFTARAQRVLHRIAAGSREGYLHAISITDPAMRASLFSPDLNRELRGYDPLDVFRAIYDRAPADDPISKIFYLDLKTYLVDDILTKVDRASMANSLEVRVPLLDHKVVEFAYSLPIALKVRDNQGKYLLRKVLERHLPKEHLERKKKGFRIPFVPWLRGGLRGWAEDVVFGRPAVNAFLSQNGVKHVWNGIQQGGGEHLGDVFSIILSFALSEPEWNHAQQEAAVVK